VYVYVFVSMVGGFAVGVGNWVRNVCKSSKLI
jgi:hypothetical protein